MNQTVESSTKKIDKYSENIHKIAKVISLGLESANCADDSHKHINPKEQRVSQLNQPQIKFLGSFIQGIINPCIEKLKEERLKFLNYEKNLKESENIMNKLCLQNDSLQNLIHKLSNQAFTLEKVIEETERRIETAEREIISLRHERGVLINALGSLQSLEAKLGELSNQHRGSEDKKDEVKDIKIELQEERNNLQRCILEQNFQIEDLKYQNQKLVGFEERYEQTNLLMKDYKNLLELLKNENDQLRRENQILQGKTYDSESKNKDMFVIEQTKEKEVENEMESLIVNVLNEKLAEIFEGEKMRNLALKEINVNNFEIPSSDLVPTKSTLDDTPKIFSSNLETPKNNFISKENNFCSQNFYSQTPTSRTSSSSNKGHKQGAIEKQNNFEETYPLEQTEFDKSDKIHKKERSKATDLKINQEKKAKSISVFITFFIIRILFSCLFFPLGAGIFLWRSFTQKSKKTIISLQ